MVSNLKANDRVGDEKILQMPECLPSIPRPFCELALINKMSTTYFGTINLERKTVNEHHDFNKNLLQGPTAPD